MEREELKKMKGQIIFELLEKMSPDDRKKFLKIVKDRMYKAEVIRRISKHRKLLSFSAIVLFPFTINITILSILRKKKRMLKTLNEFREILEKYQKLNKMLGTKSIISPEREQTKEREENKTPVS